MFTQSSDYTHAAVTSFDIARHYVLATERAGMRPADIQVHFYEGWTALQHPPLALRPYPTLFLP